STPRRCRFARDGVPSVTTATSRESNDDWPRSERTVPITNTATSATSAPAQRGLRIPPRMALRAKPLARSHAARGKLAGSRASFFPDQRDARRAPRQSVDVEAPALDAEPPAAA